MRTLRFFGASDDCFEVEGFRKGEPDEVNCWEDVAIISVRAPSGEALIVTGEFDQANTGTWTIGITNYNEDTPIPAWPIRFENGRASYSPVLVLEAPDDVVLEDLNHE